MPPKQAPYRRVLPGEAELEEDPLQLRLDIHTETVLLHEYDGPLTRTRVVSALDLAQALAGELDLTTGILPVNALWWSRTARGLRLAIWQEARGWMVRLREHLDREPRRFRLPLPGLVFVCLPGEAPYVFAAPARPRAPDDLLYHAPLLNVFDSGRVCPGSQPFPADPARVAQAFFESEFTPHGGQGKSRKYPDDLGQLWAELDGQRAYPLDDLVPQLRVGEALRLGG